MDVLRLIRQEQADNRDRFVRRQREREETAGARQQFAGIYLGRNADAGLGMVLLDGSSDPIACEILSDRLIKVGQRVLVTIPHGATVGFIDAPTT